MIGFSDEVIETYPLENEILEKALSLPDTSDYIDPVASFNDPDDKKLDLDEALDEVLDTLRPREKQVIELRFPKNGSAAATFRVIGKEFGVGPERIRQIEERALRKLRHPYRAKKLRPESNDTNYEPQEIKDQRRIRKTWNTVVNAYHMQDAQRARHAIAFLKANSLGFSRLSLIADITKMLEDPYYPQVSDEIIDKYLQRLTVYSVSVRNSLRTLERGNEHISQEIRRMEHLVGKLPNQALRKSNQTNPVSETIPNSSTSQPKTLAELLAAQETAFQNGDFETVAAIQTEIAQRGLKPPTTRNTQTDRQTPNTSSRQADNSANRPSANKATSEQTGSTNGSRESQQNPKQEQRPPVIRIKVPAPKSPTIEQRRNLITHRNIAAAVMLVFGMGLGFVLAREGIGVVNDDKSGFNIRLYHPDNTLGIRLEWSDFGPIDLRRPIYVGEQPLEYPQVTNRRWLEVDPTGINFHATTEITYQPR